MNSETNTLFLKVFPKYGKLHARNEQRMKQFYDYSMRMLDSNTPVASVEEGALDPILQMNRLGFYTNEAQEGGLSFVENPVFLYGEEKGEYEYKISNDGEKIRMTSRLTTEKPGIVGFIPIKLVKYVKEYFQSKPYISFDIVEIVKNSNVKEEDSTYVTFYEHTYEDGSSDFEGFTSYSLKMDDDEYKWNESLLYEEEPQSYGGGVSGLVLDRKEWALVHFIDSRKGINATDKTDGLFHHIIDALKYSLRTYGKRSGLFYRMVDSIRSSKIQNGKGRRLHSKTKKGGKKNGRNTKKRMNSKATKQK